MMPELGLRNVAPCPIYGFLALGKIFIIQNPINPIIW